MSAKVKLQENKHSEIDMTKIVKLLMWQKNLTFTIINS